MDEANYNSVVDSMRTSDGLMFGLPVVLDTADESVQPGQKVLLQYEGKNLAVMEVESKFLPNKPKEAKMCYGTSSLEHPGVQMIAMERGKYYIGGRIHGTNILDSHKSPWYDTGVVDVVKVGDYSLAAAESVLSLCHWAVREGDSGDSGMTCIELKEHFTTLMGCWSLMAQDWSYRNGCSRARRRHRYGRVCRRAWTWWLSSAATLCTARTTSCSRARCMRTTSKRAPCASCTPPAALPRCVRVCARAFDCARHQSGLIKTPRTVRVKKEAYVAMEGLIARPVLNADGKPPGGLAWGAFGLSRGSLE
jgi:hypothetical protein